MGWLKFLLISHREQKQRDGILPRLSSRFARGNWWTRLYYFVSRFARSNLWISNSSLVSRFARGISGFVETQRNSWILSKIPGCGSYDESSKSAGFHYLGVGMVSWDWISQQFAISKTKKYASVGHSVYRLQYCIRKCAKVENEDIFCIGSRLSREVQSLCRFSFSR